jgi:hypothetical protein
MPICDIARDRRGLIERHADPLLLAPDDVTANLRAVRLKDKIETLEDVITVATLSVSLQRVSENFGKNLCGKSQVHAGCRNLELVYLPDANRLAKTI